MHRSGTRGLTALVAGTTLAGCALLRPQPVDVTRVEVSTAEGVRYVDLVEGIGRPIVEGDLVLIEYEAFLADGTPVDSSRDRGRPLRVRLGEAPIEGWNEGLLGMRTNGLRRIEVPAHLAYGEAGVPDLVPPDADMVFEIELLGGIVEPRE